MSDLVATVTHNKCCSCPFHVGALKSQHKSGIIIWHLTNRNNALLRANHSKSPYRFALIDLPNLGNSKTSEKNPSDVQTLEHVWNSWTAGSQRPHGRITYYTWNRKPPLGTISIAISITMTSFGGNQKKAKSWNPKQPVVKWMKIVISWYPCFIRQV